MRCSTPAGTSSRPGSCRRNASACGARRAGAGSGRPASTSRRRGRGHAAPRSAPAAACGREPRRRLRRRGLRCTRPRSRTSRACSGSTCGRRSSSRAAVPYMLDAGGGSIVCVSARAAVHPFGGAVGYVSSKAAVLAFAQAVAADYRDDGVRCNAVLPSVIDTPANRRPSPMPITRAGCCRRRSPGSSGSCARTSRPR